MTQDSKTVLWRNLSALMYQHWGEENLNKLSRVAGVSPATPTRIKAQHTSVGVDVVDRIAQAFGVQSSDLLDPFFDAATSRKPFSPLARDLAAELDEISDPDLKERAYALAIQVIQLGTAVQPPPPPPPPPAPLPSVLRVRPIGATPIPARNPDL